jgi:hypothetical protein
MFTWDWSYVNHISLVSISIIYWNASTIILKNSVWYSTLDSVELWQRQPKSIWLGHLPLHEKSHQKARVCFGPTWSSTPCSTFVLQLSYDFTWAEGTQIRCGVHAEPKAKSLLTGHLTPPKQCQGIKKNRMEEEHECRGSIGKKKKRPNPTRRAAKRAVF